ncbi:MAG: glycosyltransferase family 4 protein [Candidatus Aenigmarchaeota archaeon]|nr:glycosyltransferase family 4 protein [Candidatus Aenigmarchaeota archaeon]
MRVLILGWEFPPAKTGGLGTHCYELVKNLGEKGISVLLFIPKRLSNVKHNLKNVEIVEVGSSVVSTYNTTPPETFEKGYGWNFFQEVESFNKKCVDLAMKYDFDVIHSHDWISVPAGIEIKKRKSKPFVLTMHSTEYDRTANIFPNQRIVEIEKSGVLNADLVITVSEQMKVQLIERYGADSGKITVIYNGIDRKKFFGLTEKGNRKVILFLGRLTNQKGPIFFLQTAAKVLEKRKDVLFAVSGQGEKLSELIKTSINMNIMGNVVFTGYLSEDEMRQAYSMADAYVMPSVAEPFGITALEAIASGTPVIVSKNAGVAEKISHCFKVDYWDTHEMANIIMGILDYPVLGKCMRRNSYRELDIFGWDSVADKTIDVYRRSL